MTSFLFWNLNGKRLDRAVAQLAFEHGVDIIVLAESPMSPKVVLRTLNLQKGGRFYAPFSLSEKVSIYTRFPKGFSQAEFETSHISIQQIQMPDRIGIILVAVHLPSKLYFSSEGQGFESVELARAIRAVEEKVGHSRTVLVGDLNMNPFEGGVIAASALHAVMSREVAVRGTRTVQYRKYPFFYNPMWGHLGDGRGSVPGTHYYEQHEQVALFWHMFDQVLIRPGLIPLFRGETLNIVTNCGDVSLLTSRGIPDAKIASDHLPIVFNLDL